MPESETSKKITRLVKMLDKFIRDIKKDTDELLAAARELKRDQNNED